MGSGAVSPTTSPSDVWGVQLSKTNLVEVNCFIFPHYLHRCASRQELRLAWGQHSPVSKDKAVSPPCCWGPGGPVLTVIPDLNWSFRLILGVAQGHIEAPDLCEVGITTSAPTSKERKMFLFLSSFLSPYTSRLNHLNLHFPQQSSPDISILSW